MMKPRAAKYRPSLQSRQVFRIVSHDWRGRVTAVLFALSWSSHANETAGAMMASAFSFLGVARRKCWCLDRRSVRGSYAISIWLGVAGSDHGKHLSIRATDCEQGRLDDCEAVPHRQRGKYWRSQTIEYFHFDLQANTLMEGCCLQHGLFFAPYRLYLHCENGIGVKRWRDCLFTEGGMREEFIGARRKTFESFLGLRMLWG
jgi:hypothetical protein